MPRSSPRRLRAPRRSAALRTLDEVARGEVLVEAAESGGGLPPGVATGPFGRGRGELGGEERRVEQLARVGGEGVGVAAFDEEAGAAVVDERAQPAHCGGDDRRAARSRFEGDE